MARSRKIKRTRKKKSGSFLPDSLQAFIARRLVDSVALLFLGLAVFIAASLLTYSSGDPSWNTAADEGQTILNYGGVTGAWLSDVLLQTLGFGAFVIAAVFGIWSYRIFYRQSVRPISFRIAAILVAAILSSVATAQIPSGNWSVHPYLGSSAGAIIFNTIYSVLESVNIPKAHLIIAILSSILALGVFLFAAAFRGYEIAAFWFRIKVAAFTIASFAISAAQRFYDWVVHYNDPLYQRETSDFGLFEKLRAMKEEYAISRADKATSSPKLTVKTADVDDYAEPKKVAPTVTSAQAATTKPAGSIPVVKPQEGSEKPKAKVPSSDQQRFTLSDVDGEWELPPLSLIQDVPPEDVESKLDEEALRRNAELLQNVLADFNINGDIVSIHPGPVVTLYEFEPAPGTKSSKIISLSDDIARSMSAVSVRCAVVPGRNVIGIELPNKVRQTVFMKEMLTSRNYEKTKAKLPLILGKDIGGQPIMADLAKMPHLLVAGTTGSGKSVAVNTMIMSLLYRMSPEECRFIMIDPKMLELSVYDDIPHLLTPVVTEPGKAVVALKWAVKEMEDRYRNMSKLGVRNIEGYNQRIQEAIKNNEQIMHKVQTGFDPDTGKPTFEDRAMALNELPFIVVIVDEFADLMLVAGKDVENAIQRLAQMARAAGIHLIMATQRPSVDVITGVVKANFPTRISFQVTSKIDSRTILGEGGAEQLLGMGDMLYMAPGGRITRVHGPFVSDGDVEKAADFLRAQASPVYIDDVTSEDADFGGSEVMNAMFGGGESSDVDELYDQAVAIIAREGKVSTSFIQRHLQIGYNRAARIVEEMERQGVISAANATGKRHILISDHSGV
ncbi:MAG: cell division protein FtsK [Alphaproteobacteria bacterium]|nr:cell division protein FtsK [Alphaproteobacteria bacterium]